MLDTLVSCKCSFCANKDTPKCGHRMCVSCVVDDIFSPTCIVPEICKINQAAKLNVICNNFLVKEWDQ